MFVRCDIYSQLISERVRMQAFIQTAEKIYEKIQSGVYDVNNEVGWQELISHNSPGAH